MEESTRLISAFCSELRSFCSRLETNCTDLRTRIGKVPAAEESKKSGAKFVELMNGRIQAATAKVEALKAMSMETVSFEELFGHCNEVFKRNERSIEDIENVLEKYGYKRTELAENEMVENEDGFENYDVRTSLLDDQHKEQISPFLESVSLRDLGISASSLAALSSEERNVSSLKQEAAPRQVVLASNSCEEQVSSDHADDMSLSYMDLGLSATSLAALSNQFADVKPQKPQKDIRANICDTSNCEDVGRSVPPLNTETDDCASEPIASTSPGSVYLEPVTTEEFNGAPSWLKWQVSLQVLNEFLSKLNTLFALKEKKADGLLALKPDELASLAYAAQVQKACLLLLVKLQRLETGFHEGATTYTVCIQRG